MSTLSVVRAHAQCSHVWLDKRQGGSYERLDQLLFGGLVVLGRWQRRCSRSGRHTTRDGVITLAVAARARRLGRRRRVLAVVPGGGTVDTGLDAQSQKKSVSGQPGKTHERCPCGLTYFPFSPSQSSNTPAS